MMIKTFSERLIKLRTKEGMSQKELAIICKITPATLSNYENGIYLPPLDKALRLTKALHTSLDYLTGLTDMDTGSLTSKEIQELYYYAEFLKYKRRKKYDTFYTAGGQLTHVAEENILNG